MRELPDSDVAVIGGGAVGLVAAALLARSGLAVTLVAPPAPPDARSTALLAGSVRLLETMKAWPRLLPHAAPLRRLRIVDATRSLVRAPEVVFAATELGLEAFGYTVGNDVLLSVLGDVLMDTPVTRFAEPATIVEPGPTTVRVSTAGERFRARLVVGADGRRSLCRTAAGIGTRSWGYGQSALVVDVAHELPHEDTSTEFHTEEGPFTLAPLPGDHSGLVCVGREETVRTLAALDDAELAEALGRRCRFVLGRLRIVGRRATFPVSVVQANRMATRRIALVGEAAHALPPIGAQGLNLGLRDAAHLAEIVDDCSDRGLDVGSAEVLADYERARRADVGSRTAAIDLLNRSLLAESVPLQIARGLGLRLLEQVGPLRRAVMQEGLLPRRNAPRLMREQALSGRTGPATGRRRRGGRGVP